MEHSYVHPLTDSTALSRGGGKAAFLARLSAEGVLIPETLYCTWDAHEAYRQHNQAVLTTVRAELDAALVHDHSYAVRSSAELEDHMESSCAGQFLSCLSVSGTDAVYQAMQRVWDSADQESVRTYLRARHLDADKSRMAVVIQDMVKPVYSGIAFSKNPLTGLDETVVEAVEGSAEALMQQGVTPSRWVHKWGAWIEEPASDTIPRGLIQKVVEDTQSIAERFGQPVDLEWAFDGSRLYWLQMRGITTIHDVDVYSNHISKEMLPGLVKPLVWSVNVPLKSAVWGEILEEFLGPNQIDTQRLVGKFYHRAYFNMGLFGDVFDAFGMPRESMELMMGIEMGGADRPSLRPSSIPWRLLPRLITTLFGKLTLGRKIPRMLEKARAEYAALKMDHLQNLDETELLAIVDRLYQVTRRLTYYNINVPILLSIHLALLKSRLEEHGIEMDDVDLHEGQASLVAFDPNRRLAAMHRIYADLDPSTQAQIKGASYEAFLKLPGAYCLQQETEAFIRDFGHLSDSTNDFSVPPWRENPRIVLSMLSQFSTPEASQRLSWADSGLSWRQRLRLYSLYRRVRRYRCFRDAVGSLYIYGYGLFRPPLLEIGQRFAQRGLIDGTEDVSYLEMQEVRQAIADRTAAGYQEQITARKADMEAVRNIAPPTVIYGQEAPPPHVPDGDQLRGTSASRGVYTGRARLVQGIEDWSKVCQGDVLVIPYSDVGWTPLFAKAGAVVAESGGLLSHSAIVAREYGIPAVVSVAGALSLKSGETVTVDGFRGLVTRLASQDGPTGDRGDADDQAAA